MFATMILAREQERYYTEKGCFLKPCSECGANKNELCRHTFHTDATPAHMTRPHDERLKGREA
jgi:hypothetical protein